MQPVYLICGVSGSGKSWVCRQLQDQYAYLAHDLHYEDHVAATHTLAKHAIRPVLTECPFGERVTREQLEVLGVKVIPVFVIEPVHIVRKRFEEREKRELPKNVATRAMTIIDRAREWGAFYGSSDDVLTHLRGLPHE
jgi:shikimate kinase